MPVLTGFILKQALGTTGNPSDPVISSTMPIINSVYHMLTVILMILLMYTMMHELLVAQGGVQ